MKRILEKAKIWLQERTMRQRVHICVGMGFLCVIIASIGAAMIPTNSPLVLLGILGVVAGVLLNLLWCRCPHCGRYLDRVAVWADYCPCCGGRLDKKE